MKKKIAALFLGVCILMGISHAFAAQEETSSLNVSVKLNTDGSADITEIWIMDAACEGTEHFKTLNAISEHAVSQFSVKDDRGITYTKLANWDSNATFREKAYKCGILATDNGYRLCWGISQMGKRTYTLSYHLAGLVKHYSDYDGLYHQILLSSMSFTPRIARAVVSMDDVVLSKDNSRVWVFGSAGEARFLQKAIAAWVMSDSKEDNVVSLLIGFDHGIFNAPKGEGTFQAVIDRAYEPIASKWRSTGIAIAIVVAIGIAVFAWLRSVKKNIRLSDGDKLPRANEKKMMPYSRPVLEGDIAATHALMRLGEPFGSAGDPLGAYLMQWGMSGVAAIDETTQLLQLKKAPSGEAPENALYEWLLSEADEGHLPLIKRQKWLKKHKRAFKQWQNDVEHFGESKLKKQGLAAEDSKGKLRLTLAGVDKYTEALGFKAYLKRFANQEPIDPLSKGIERPALVFAAYYSNRKKLAPGFGQLSASTYSGDFVYTNCNYLLFNAAYWKKLSMAGKPPRRWYTIIRHGNSIGMGMHLNNKVFLRDEDIYHYRGSGSGKKYD